MWFEAKIESLPNMLNYVRQQALSASVPTEVIQKLELACEEAIVNIISYAYHKQDHGVIEINCESTPFRFEMIIKDHGRPFNPMESEVDLQRDIPVQDRHVGGIGIYLIRRLMDETSYQRLAEENILRMAVRF